MSKVEMEALDSFHASAANPSDVKAGDTFTINEGEANELEKAGLAKPTSKASDRPAPARRKAAR